MFEGIKARNFLNFLDHNNGDLSDRKGHKKLLVLGTSFWLINFISNFASKILSVNKNTAKWYQIFPIFKVDTHIF